MFFPPLPSDVTNAAIIEAFYPAIDAALKYDGILGMHEYAGPFMNSSYLLSSSDGEREEQE